MLADSCLFSDTKTNFEKKCFLLKNFLKIITISLLKVRFFVVVWAGLVVFCLIITFSDLLMCYELWFSQKLWWSQKQSYNKSKKNFSLQYSKLSPPIIIFKNECLHCFHHHQRHLKKWNNNFLTFGLHLILYIH